MDYSPLLPPDEEGPCEHPLLLEFQDGEEIKKFSLDQSHEDDVLKGKGGDCNGKKVNSTTTTTTNNKSGSKLFGRSLSKSKSATDDTSPYIEDNSAKGKKTSSPIEIKGSPGKHRDGSLNKGSSSGDNSTTHSTSNNRISFFKALTRRNITTNQGKHKSKPAL